MNPSPTEATRGFAEVVERSAMFLLSGHVNIDGDSLGSMLGMYHFLRQRGKLVRALCFEPLAERYAFLGGSDIVEVFDPAVHTEFARGADVFMMFDFSGTGRMPGLWEIVRGGRALKVCVDHHPAESLPGDLNLHVASAPATGKIVLDLIRALGGEVDRRIAEALLVAIATDTGWFRYNNTTAQVLRDAADLLALGLDAAAIYREIYQRNEVPLIRLMGRVAASLKEELGGRLLWATVPQSLVVELGVGPFETDELLDLMRTSNAAECVALFRELVDGSVRVNLRSRGRLDVSALARRIGGGGHLHAGGATLEGPLGAAAARIVAMVKEALQPLMGAGLAAAPRTRG